MHSLLLHSQRVIGEVMLVEKMYVRCPADWESASDPRVFICGQIVEIDKFRKTVRVRIYDPFSCLVFFEDLPKGEIEISDSMVQHCTFFLDSIVLVEKRQCKVRFCTKEDDEFYYYYLQDINSKEVFYVSEKEIIASFNNGRIDPSRQLKTYEFQNPYWFLGHAIVSKSINILNNSIYGFKELAGSKIYLLPHQVNSIMRCLQEEPCRYMLADEVGMGKTIEAISVLKIYMQDRSQKKVLVIIPKTLKEQWKIELFLKFNIAQGRDHNDNSVIVKSINEINEKDCFIKWDFVIVDEVHRYLGNHGYYMILHMISKNTRNLLLLSATPVQQRKDEYLSLLRLLQPDKYDSYSSKRFSELVEKQSHIVQKTALILDDLSDYEKEIYDVMSEEEDPRDSEDCQDLYEEITEELEEVCGELKDEKLGMLFDDICFDNEDLGVYAIKVIISYICSNYQIESKIIRNRRRMLETSENGKRILPSRELETITYELDNDRNLYEVLTYELLSDWITEHAHDNNDSVEQVIKPLLSSFFSSSWAFLDELEKAKRKGLEFDVELLTNARYWNDFEQFIIDHITAVINDPIKYEDYYSTRIMTVFEALYEEFYDKKMVLFTNYGKTFEIYKIALEKLFPDKEISFFGAKMSKDEMELNAYRFQNDSACRLMLCDYTGGEGRNFQCADYILHIDLPWDANMIEQRIGRLDRLERDQDRPVVHSVVVHSLETFEYALFRFWNEGLRIFTQSLSGMEIIMKDINKEIEEAIREDFKFGLFEKIPKIIELADYMRTEVRKEQNFDVAGSIYRPMYNELKRLIEYYIENENELFAKTMKNWASLAGFHEIENKEGVVVYSAHSFVPKSAINALLIPPKWNDYIHSAQNTFITRVENQYNRKKSVKNIERSIRGTFIRKQAIENDYLHFFAPGDAVFDCIVDNAICSCKGRSSAFAFPAEISWIGIIYTWSQTPDLDYLLQNGVSVHALSPYRNYLMSEQMVIPVAIENEDQVTDAQVVREYNQLIAKGFKQNNVVHLGKRGGISNFIRKESSAKSNIGWFRREYSEEDWNELVDYSRKEALKKATEIFKKKSNIRGAKEEMERTRSARAANIVYFGLEDKDIEKMKETQEIILNAIKRPRLVLESAAFVWMVKRNEKR